MYIKPTTLIMNSLYKNLATICILTSFVSCTQSEPKSSTSEQVVVQSTTDTIQLKDSQKDEVLKHYFSLKDALVASNAPNAQIKATTLTTSLKASQAFAKSVLMCDSIAKTSDLAKQRSTFTNLSNELIAQFLKPSLLKGSFYLQFCPMANEGNGGYWLAAEQEVRNPYYGDEMLNCGEVKRTFK
jgi:hypothetical protein